MHRPLRTLAALAAGALGVAAAGAAARSSRPPAPAPPVQTDPPAEPVVQPPPTPPPVLERRPGRVRAMLVLGWLLVASMPTVFLVVGIVSAVRGPDAIGADDWLVWGSFGTTLLGLPLVWAGYRDDEDRMLRHTWAYTLWAAAQRRPVRGGDGTTGSGYSSSSSYDPTYGAAWSGGATTAAAAATTAAGTAVAPTVGVEAGTAARTDSPAHGTRRTSAAGPAHRRPPR